MANSYGPINALADILGALWDKQRENKIASMVDDSSAEANKQMSAQPIIDQPKTSPIAAKNADFLIPINNQPQQQQNSILDAAMNGGNAEQAAFNLGASQAVSDAKLPADEQAVKTEHPEWYVGDTYVGDDADAKAAAQKQQVNNDSINKYTFANPIYKETGVKGYTPAPTYTQSMAAMNKTKSDVQREIFKRYGAEGVKIAQPLIEDAYKSKQQEYVAREDTQNRAVMNKALTGDLSTNEGRNQALIALGDYNNKAKQMGLPGVDMTIYGPLINSGKIKITKDDTGGAINYYAANDNGTAMGKDENGKPIYMKPILSDAKTISPDTSARIAAQKEANATNNSVKLQIAQMNNDSRERVASMRGSGSGSRGSSSEESKQLAMDKYVISQHQKYVNDHGCEDEDDPNWGAVQQAQGRIYSNYSSGDSGSSDSDSGSDDKYADQDGSDPTALWIEDAYKHNKSTDWIKQKLRDKGYGDTYDSYLYD